MIDSILNGSDLTEEALLRRRSREIQSQAGQTETALERGDYSEEKDSVNDVIFASRDRFHN